METKRQAIQPYERHIIREECPTKKKKEANPFRAYVRKQRAKKIKPILAVLLLIGIWYVLIGRGILPEFVQNMSWTRQPPAQEKLYYEVSCSEANVARMLALSCGYNLEGEVAEEDDLWYEKYYKALAKADMKALKEENAFQLISYEKLKESFSENFGSSIADMVLQKKESYQLYEVLGYLEEALSKSGKGKVTECEGAILATPNDEQPLKAWQVLTTQGMMNFEGLVVAPLKNQTVTLVTCGSQILGVTEIKSQVCEVKQCKVISVKNEKVTYETEGCQFTYNNQILTQEQVGGVFDLTLKDETITDFKACTYEKVDTLLKITDQKIRLENAGVFNYDTVAVSDATDLNRFHSLEDLTYGVKVGYIADGKKITSLQVVGQGTQHTIRVLLTDAKGKYEQNEVILKGNADYDQMYQGKAITLPAGTVWDSRSAKLKDGESVRFIPRGDSLLTLASITKGGESPSYKGIIEVTQSEKGLTVINEVDLEDYVAGVIPSEMPTSYPEEALKAQAVAARTYGASCMESSKFMAYGANVDDSTASQVYNRIGANKTSYKAASETAGLVLKSGNSLISGKFFAASCGYTANFGEVWAGQKFPTDSPSYLSAEKQYEDKLDVGDLEKEEDFKKFISLTAADLDAYDEESPWFRWQVTLTEEKLEKLVKTNLKAIHEKNNSLIFYQTAEGGKASGVIEDIGTVKGLEARERGEGGNIMKLAVLGSKGTAVIETEYYIRSLFASTEDVSVNVERADQSEVEKAALLPSAFFTIEEQKADADGSLKSITLSGGGSGHGVGLSQDGAKGMAEKGYDYKKILEHFYKDTQLVNLWDKK